MGVGGPGFSNRFLSVQMLGSRSLAFRVSACTEDFRSLFKPRFRTLSHKP